MQFFKARSSKPAPPKSVSGENNRDLTNILGVGTTRFSAQKMLDLLDGNKTERTQLKMVRSKHYPFPPEPARSAAINLTRWVLHQADQNHGRRNIWLHALDALGLGFDSYPLLVKYDLTSVHAHRTGKIHHRSLILRRDIHQNCTCGGQKMLNIDRRDHKTACTRVRIFCHQV